MPTGIELGKAKSYILLFRYLSPQKCPKNCYQILAIDYLPINKNQVKILEVNKGPGFKALKMNFNLNDIFDEIFKVSIDLFNEGISVASISPGWVKTDSGGINALIDVQTSVTGIKKIINELRLENTGRFWDYNGELIPW